MPLPFVLIAPAAYTTDQASSVIAVQTFSPLVCLDWTVRSGSSTLTPIWQIWDEASGKMIDYIKFSPISATGTFLLLASKEQPADALIHERIPRDMPYGNNGFKIDSSNAESNTYSVGCQYFWPLGAASANKAAAVGT